VALWRAIFIFIYFFSFCFHFQVSTFDDFSSKKDYRLYSTLKANLSWSQTWANLWQLIASLSVILTNLNLNSLKSDLQKRTKKDETQKKTSLLHSSSTFMKFSSSLALEYIRMPLITFCWVQLFAGIRVASRAGIYGTGSGRTLRNFSGPKCGAF